MRSIILILLFIGTSTTYSQQCNFTLKGNIIDFHDGKPLVDASIVVIKDGNILKSTTSDSKGKYLIKGLCIGKVELYVSHTECNSKTIPLEIKGNTTRKISLEHHLENLNEIVITGEKREQGISKATSVQTLKTADIEQFSDASIGDALKEISGVSSLNTGSTIVKPIIQGLNSSRILIITNNVRLQDQEWGIEHAPNVDLNTADRLTVIKGSGALQYGGDAIGGVVLAKPKALATKDTVFGKTILSGSSNGRGGSVSSSVDKGFNNGIGLRVQGTYKRFGDFRAPDYFLTNTGTEQKAASFNFGINKFLYGAELYYSYYDTEIGILQAADLGNVTDLIRAINSPVPEIIEDFSFDIGLPRQEVKHHLIKLNSYLRLKRLGKLGFQYSFQFNDRQEFDNRSFIDDDIPVVDLELTTHNLDLLLEVNNLDNAKISTGVSAIYQENFADPTTGVRRVIPDYEKYGLGVFGGIAHDVTDDLLIDIGARVDYTRIDAQKFYRGTFFDDRGYNIDFADIIVEQVGSQILVNPVFDYTTFSATLGLAYNINETLDLQLNYGLASRPPNPSELFSEGLNQASVAFELGDLRIEEETSNKIALTLKGSLFNGRLNFNVTPYINLINDYIVLQPSEDGVITTSRGAFQEFEYIQNDARLVGFDVDATYDYNDYFQFKTSFSYLRGDDTEAERPIINIPPANWFNTISYNNKKLNNLSLQLKSEAVFEQTRFPDNNFIARTVVNNEFVDELVDVSTPPPGYHLLHFNSSIQFNLSKLTKLELGFAVDNIFNTNYRQYLNRFRFFADELGRNFKLRIKLNY
ncbi:TonB-dependent receptor [Winogradskyella immobilis]|uniref:TonB-dependent receptor n=1 Tax=Winogradskyella immobilis TaxID=2816852 RepID=A0ABS8EPB4_9FLAO|nr:TonB-dependent receptor [Winogradskyella immobilis]MCC1484152.1 TonB-dependent receptor [Winogradskyella immobilis]MCG0016244.1 TonB-dependent receptor [Winogradskyella immobilis]